MSILDRLRRPALVRDPSAATTNLGFTTPGRAQLPEWDAANAITWGFYGNVFVYACVQAIATDLAARKFRVGADPTKPTDYDPKAPLARLLGPPPGGPNRVTSARSLLAWAIAQRLVTGRLAWELELDSRDQPVALWPLTSKHLRAVHSQGGGRYFTAFEYGPVHRPKRLPAERVFYHWRPSADDWREPESALRAARLDVSVAVMQDRYDYAFLKNDARPAAIVVHEAFAEDGERESWRQQFRADHQGPDNAGSVAFAEAEGGEGVSGTLLVETLGLSQRDAMFVERYENKIRGVCVGLGVPLSRLMDASKRTFSNAGQETVNYWRSTVWNEAQDLQDAINIQLAPRFGSNVGWFDFSDVEALKPDRKFTQIDGLRAVEEAIATPNEVRADADLPALPDGDDLKPPPPTPPPIVVPPPEDRTRDEPRPPSEADIAAQTEARRTAIWRSADSTVRGLERSWERTMRRLFSRQVESTIARLEGKRGRQAYERAGESIPDPSTIFDPGFWTATTEEIAQGLYEAVFAVGGARISDQFGIAFDIAAPYAEMFVAARANQLAGQVTTTTYDAIKATMNEGVAAGEGIPDLAGRVREVFAQATKVRARTIARTEVISAYNGSAVTVASQLPVDVAAGQEWIATRDGRTRESHAEMDGAQVRVGQAFDNGLAYPGDPSGDAAETVNCRCTIAFLTPEEMGDRVKPPRMVARGLAAAVLALVQPGQRLDERAMRTMLREAA